MLETIKTLSKKITQSEQSNLIISLVVLCLIITFLTPVFLTEQNLMNVLRQASLIAICGIGMVMIILVGEIDLSVGSAQAIIGIVTVSVLNNTGSFFLALIAALIVGAVIGLINGLLVTQAKINSLIATLGTMAILRGVAMVSTKAVSIQAKVESFADFGTGYWGPFPKPVIIALVLFVAFYYVLNHTAFGRYIYAVGGNSSAANLSGLPVDRIKITVYVLGGVLTALTGVILAARLNSGQPNAGLGFELQVIAAVILGGISLTGGRGTILGAIVGILILSVLSNGLILLNVSSFYHDIARGIVIILAVYVDERRRRGLAKKLLSARNQ